MTMPGYGVGSYNVTINQQNTGELSSTPQFSSFSPPPFQEGLVIDIITNESHERYGESGANVGLAIVRLIPGDRYRNEDSLIEAMPANPFMRAYPIKGDMVHITYCAGRPCYETPLNITNKIGDLTYPGLASRYGSPVLGQDRTEAAQRASAGIEPYSNPADTPPENFGNILKKFNPFAKKLRAEEGDVIIEGRFGGAIRLGSSLTRHPTADIPEPNVLITAGQWPDAPVSTQVLSPYSLTFENINDDKSSIWLVANQEVDFLASTVHEDGTPSAHLRSSDLAPDRPQPTYTGAQIFITSDRVVLNSKKNQISLFSKSEINLSARKSITIDSEKTVSITSNEDIKIKTDGTLLLQAKTVSISNLGDLAYGTAGEYTIVGKNIFIGKRDKTQPMVLGTSLAIWLQDLMDAFIIEIPKSIATLNPGPFVEAITRLRVDLGTTPLDAAGAVFNSEDNFVARKNTGSDVFQTGVQA